MKRKILLIVKGLGLGLAAGLFLAGVSFLLFRFTHDLSDPVRSRAVLSYFLAIGVLLGSLSGWLGGLNAVLWSIVDPVLWSTAGILPATAERIDAAWLGRLEGLMERVLLQTRGIVRFLVLKFFMPRLRSGLDRYNSAVERYRLKKPGRVLTSQMMSYAALSLFIRPLWIFFYVAYGVVALAFMVFLGVPFL